MLWVAEAQSRGICSASSSSDGRAPTSTTVMSASDSESLSATLDSQFAVVWSLPNAIPEASLRSHGAELVENDRAASTKILPSGHASLPSLLPSLGETVCFTHVTVLPSSPIFWLNLSKPGHISLHSSSQEERRDGRFVGLRFREAVGLHSFSHVTSPEACDVTEPCSIRPSSDSDIVLFGETFSLFEECDAYRTSLAMLWLDSQFNISPESLKLLFDEGTLTNPVSLDSCPTWSGVSVQESNHSSMSPSDWIALKELSCFCKSFCFILVSFLFAFHALSAFHRPLPPLRGSREPGEECNWEKATSCRLLLQSRTTIESFSFASIVLRRFVREKLMGSVPVRTAEGLRDFFSLFSSSGWARRVTPVRDIALCFRGALVLTLVW